MFHLLLCIMKQLRRRKKGQRWFLNMSDEMACMIAAFGSGTVLAAGLQPGEMNLLKLFFIPLAWRCFCDKMMDIGLIPRFKHGDILVYMIIGFFCSFSTLVEWNSCPDPMRKTIQHTFCRMQPFESRSFSVANTMYRARKGEKYQIA